MSCLQTCFCFLTFHAKCMTWIAIAGADTSRQWNINVIGFAPNGHAEIHRPQVWNICLVADVLAQIEKRDMCLFLSRQDPLGLGGLCCCSKKLCTLHTFMFLTYHWPFSMWNLVGLVWMRQSFENFTILVGQFFVQLVVMFFHCHPVDIDKFWRNTAFHFSRQDFHFWHMFCFESLLTLPISSFWDGSLLWDDNVLKGTWHGPQNIFLPRCCIAWRFT